MTSELVIIIMCVYVKYMSTKSDIIIIIIASFGNNIIIYNAHRSHNYTTRLFLFSIIVLQEINSRRKVPREGVLLGFNEFALKSAVGLARGACVSCVRRI